MPVCGRRCWGDQGTEGSDLIRCIEEDATNLEQLCGEILVTLTVNMERTNY